MSDLAEFIEARVDEIEAAAGQRSVLGRLRDFVISYIVSTRGLVNLHRAPGHDCPDRDGEHGRRVDYEEDCPTLMLLAYPYRDHPDWRGWPPTT